MSPNFFVFFFLTFFFFFAQGAIKLTSLSNEYLCFSVFRSSYSILGRVEETELYRDIKHCRLVSALWQTIFLLTWLVLERRPVYNGRYTCGGFDPNQI